MSMLRLSLTTAIAVCAPFYAQAAVDAAGAELLTRQLTESLSSLHPVELDGAPVVKPDGDAFAVTLPAMTFKDRREEFNVVVPQVAARLTPMSDSLYAYTATLPTTFMTVTDATGAPRGTATLTSQEIKGEWNVAGHHFNNSLALLKGVTYTDTKADLVVKVGEVGAVNQMAARANGHVDGQGSINMRNLGVTYANAEQGRAAQVKIEGVGITSTVQDYDLSGLNNLPQGTPANPADAAGVLSRLGTLMGGAQQNGDGTTQLMLNATGINMTFVESKNEPPVTITLPLVKLGGSAVSDANKLIDLNMIYEHSGLVVKPIESRILADLLPATAKFDVQVANIPASELFQTASRAASAMLSGKPRSGDKSATMQGSAQSALALMDKAQTAFVINNISFTARSLNALSQGTIRASQASPVGAVGTVDTRINGISELITKLSESMNTPAAEGKPQPQPDANVQSVLFALSMLQMQGKPVTNAAPSGHTYKVELTPQGGVRLNGVEMINLSGMVPDMREPTKQANEPALNP